MPIGFAKLNIGISRMAKPKTASDLDWVIRKN
jgi:hypothetical protein